MEASRRQPTVDKPEDWVSEPAWKNHSVAAKHSRIDEDKLRIMSEIAQHLMDESDFNFVKMHLLIIFSDLIHQFGNLINVSSKLPERVMMDHNQVYWQTNHHDAAFQNTPMNVRQEVFQCWEQNANTA